MKHVQAVLELLSAVMQDTRFMDAYNKRIEEVRAVTMETWMDDTEDLGTGCTYFPCNPSPLSVNAPPDAPLNKKGA